MVKVSGDKYCEKLDREMFENVKYINISIENVGK